VLPSLNVPVAVSCWLVLGAIVELAGVMASEVRFEASTVADTLLLTAPCIAVIVVVPRFRPVTTPLTVIEATLKLEELHVTVFVMSCVVESEKVPVAVICCRVPSGRDGVVGVIAIAFKVALVTVRVAVAEMPPEVAVITVVPAAIPNVRPCAPFKLARATEELLDVHSTEEVTLCVLESVNVPVAVN